MGGEASASGAGGGSSRPVLSAATTVVELPSLPEGTVLDPSWEGTPGAIAGQRKIEGVKLVRQVQSYGGGHQQVFIQIERVEPTLPVTPPDAAAPAQDHAERTTALRSSGLCLASAPSPAPRRSKGAPRSNDDAPSWETIGLSKQTTLVMPDGPSTRTQRVQQLHLEQLVVTPAGPALESRDAWVDSSTGGARVHATAHLPLRDLGGTPQGLHLFAARHGDEVVFVAQTAPTSQNVFLSRDGRGNRKTSCDHLVVRLPLRRGMSEFASLHVLARISDASKNEVSALRHDEAANDEAANAEAPRPVRGRGGILSRVGQVMLSESWEPAESTPLVSFSTGWSGREHAD